jgi:hypothetical protein
MFDSDHTGQGFGELFAEELELLQNKASNWFACVEAAQRHPDWNPANPDLAISIISGSY